MDQKTAKAKLTKVINIKKIITVTALAMVVLHLCVSQWIFTSTETFLTLHLSFALVVVFLTKIDESDKRAQKALLVISILLTIICAVYIIVNVDKLRMNAWFNSSLDLVVGTILLIMSFYAAALGYGLFIPIFVGAVVFYPFFGKYLPQPFTTFALPIKKVISNMSIGLKSGLYDSTLTISSNYIFLFCVFGGLLSATGVQSFFFELGKLLVGKLKSGPALMAVINSAFVGSVVGSAIANVSITGPYTIPSMKQAGYKPEQAGAIESVASNGGQILPPVMGIMAFAMAGFSGIPYWEICKMALVPAIIYYLILTLYCQLNALKSPVLRNRKIEKQDIDMSIIKFKSIGFIVPICVIIVLFARGFSCMNVAFWTILSILIVSMIQPQKYRPSIKEIVNGFVDGAISGAKIGAICAIIGCLVTTFTTSGLSIKLTSGIATWSGGHLFVALLILWVGTIIAGMVGVSVAAYFTAAAFAVPVLQQFGVPYNISHFFLSYPAAFALLTPPVALVSLVAAQIAKADYKRTALESCKVAVTAFIFPFLFAYAPSLLLIGDPSSINFWVDIIIVFLGFVAMQISFVRYLFDNLSIIQTGLIGIGSILMVTYPIIDIAYLGIIGFVLFLLVVIVQLLKRLINKKQDAERKYAHLLSFIFI